MSEKMKEQGKRRAASRSRVIRLALVIAILLLGFATMKGLAAMKKPPMRADRAEQVLYVETVTVQPEDAQVSIRGTGLARALDVVRVTPEVNGVVVEVHPLLDVGEVIAAGEALLVIDPRAYEARMDEARASVVQASTAVLRLTSQFDNDRERLKTLERSRDLAKSEFERLGRLFTSDQVGTQSGVESAERAYNAAEDQLNQLKRIITVYPLQIKEAESGLMASEARLALRKLELEKTRIAAPFDARIKSVSVERGQYIGPGAPVLTLANDAMIEVSVPLASDDARRWLQFEQGDGQVGSGAWFNPLEALACRVRWSEEPDSPGWEGRLHRVERLSDQNRQVVVAVRVDGANAHSTDAGGLPLVDGMFCNVEIPGRTATGVFRVPQWAVSFEDTVCLAVPGEEEGQLRLKTVPVVVVWQDGDLAYVSEGLDAGDRVITTRLVDPLENTLLEVNEAAS